MDLRQIGIYGADGARRLRESDVLISGMHGLGVETAKNLILAGVKSVTLHDENSVQLWDLSGCYTFSEKDVGMNKAIVSCNKLQNIQSTVEISAITRKLSTDDLSKFQVVVFTDICIEKAIEFDDYCHNHQPPIAFIKADLRGLFSRTFCDFGPAYKSLNVNGWSPERRCITRVSNSKPTTVFFSPSKELKVKFKAGDLVVFSGVGGMSGLNDGKPRKITDVENYSITIEEDTSYYAVDGRNGIVTKLRPDVFNFKTLREALKDPGDFEDFIDWSDISKIASLPLMHLAFQALDKYIVDLGRFPIAGCSEDAKRLLDLLIKIQSGLPDGGGVQEIDRELLKTFAFGARAVLSPMATLIGGIVGEEVLKACSRMFNPIYQFFYFDSLESLPSEPLDTEEVKPLNSRYDAQISVFGSKLQKKLKEAKVLIVGSGAKGCEFLKNSALMGLCCGDGGKLSITDDGVVARSNLSRYFMFREEDIGEAKSEVGVSAASSMNREVHGKALHNRVSPESGSLPDETLWEDFNIIINAIENIDDRCFIDKICLYLQKTLLDSSTFGSSCITHIGIPHLTENFGASLGALAKQEFLYANEDALAKQAPSTKVNLFPHNVFHCLKWARCEFDDLFEKTPAEVNAYLSNPSDYISTRKNVTGSRETLERLLKFLGSKKCETFKDCVTWARFKFEEYFVKQIKDLTSLLPKDAASLDGTKFWSQPRNFPHPLEFNAKNNIEFIMIAANLRAECFGIPVPDWSPDTENKVIRFLDKTVPKYPDDYKPSEALCNIVIGGDKVISPFDDKTALDVLIYRLGNCRKELSPDYRVTPIQFHKGAHYRYHMNLIANLVNLKGRCYGIDADLNSCKTELLLMREIPKVASCTPIATGLICLELYKIIDGNHNLNEYRNGYVDRMVACTLMTQPKPPALTKFREMSWTAWDRWIFRGNNPTFRELISWLQNKGLTVNKVHLGRNLPFYVAPFPERMLDSELLRLLKADAKADLPPEKCHFDILVLCVDDYKNKVDIPVITVYFKQGVVQFV